jgi:Domain of unknown function (DUF1918)
MQAQVGDELTVKGRRQGDEDRHGEIIRVDGANGAPPYLVRWRDGHESVFFPSSDTEIEHHTRHTSTRGRRHSLVRPSSSNAKLPDGTAARRSRQ